MRVEAERQWWDIAEVNRKVFLNYAWSYQPGEHVTILGPTNSGKTTLGYQLLQHSATPELPGVVMVMKPRDSTALKWNRSLGFKIIHTWQGRKLPWNAKKPGWTLWPKHTLTNIDADDRNLHEQFKAALSGSYAEGNKIVFADEVYGLESDLDLGQQLKAIWTRGRSMGCGLWAASQRPAYISQYAYGNASHLFLHRDSNRRDRSRYDEIGGAVNPGVVKAVLTVLPRHHFLYLRPYADNGPEMLIVRP